MSGIVPQDGIIRKLYDEARLNDIEYIASAFWQSIFQSAFNTQDDFISVCEYSPDGERSRVDQAVLRYDANQRTLAITTVHEAKREGSNVKAGEDQALNAAKRVIDKHGLQKVYAVTTWGVKFRMWVVDRKQLVLLPLDNMRDVRNDRTQYIDADSYAARCFNSNVKSMKQESLFGQVHVSQSQAAAYSDYNLQGGYTYASQPMQNMGYSYPVATTSAVPTRGQQMELDQEDLYSAQDDEAADIPAHAVSQDVEVEVKRISHTFKKDELVFDKNGRKKSSVEEDWRRGKRNGRTVWVFFDKDGKRTKYWTRRLG